MVMLIHLISYKLWHVGKDTSDGHINFQADLKCFFAKNASQEQYTLQRHHFYFEKFHFFAIILVIMFN